MLIKSVPIRHGLTWLVTSFEFLKAHRGVVWATPFLLALLLKIPVVSMLFGIGLYFFLSGIVIGFMKLERRSLFLAFQQGAWPRLLLIFALQIALSLAIVQALSPFLEPLMKAAQNGKTPSPAEIQSLMQSLTEPMLPYLPWLLLLQWFSFLYLPLACFTKQAGLRILMLSALALVKNIFPIVLYSLLMVALLLLTSVLVNAAGLLIQQLAHISVMLARFALTLLEVLIIGSFFALYCASMLMAFRDIFDQVEPASKTETDKTEVLL